MAFSSTSQSSKPLAMNIFTCGAGDGLISNLASRSTLKILDEFQLLYKNPTEDVKPVLDIRQRSPFSNLKDCITAL